MFSNTITLDDASGDDVNYDLLPPITGGSNRIVTADGYGSDTGRSLQIRQSVEGPANDRTSRTLVSFRHALRNAQGDLREVKINLTIAVDLDPVITPTVIKDLYANLLDFESDGSLTTVATFANLEQLLAGMA